jgi:hypothetical protein
LEIGRAYSKTEVTMATPGDARSYGRGGPMLPYDAVQLRFSFESHWRIADQRCRIVVDIFTGPPIHSGNRIQELSTGISTTTFATLLQPRRLLGSFVASPLWTVK